MKALHKTLIKAFEMKIFQKVQSVARHTKLVLVLIIQKILMTYRAKNKIDVFSVRGTKSFEPIMTNVTSCSASLHNKEKNLSDGKEKNLSRCKKNF